MGSGLVLGLVIHLVLALVGHLVGNLVMQWVLHPNYGLRHHACVWSIRRTDHVLGGLLDRHLKAELSIMTRGIVMELRAGGGVANLGLEVNASVGRS